MQLLFSISAALTLCCLVTVICDVYLHVTLGGVRPKEKRLVRSPLNRKSSLKFKDNFGIKIISNYMAAML